MANLLKAEFYKLFHSQSFWILEVFSFLLSGVLLLDSKSLTDNFFSAALYNVPLLYFLAIILSALFVGNDFGERTLHTYIYTGHKRSFVLFAKVFVYIIACIILLLLPVLFYGFIGALKFNLPACINWNSVITIFTSSVAMCLLPFFFAVIFRDAGRSLAIPMAIFFLMIFLMNGNYAQQVGTLLPMGQLRLIVLQQDISRLPMLMADILWIFVLYFGAVFLFNRSDLK